MVGEHILGDIGYMLKTTTSSQENYNYAHKKTRVLMEQTFGRWKRRFHCLHGEIRMASDSVSFNDLLRGPWQQLAFPHPECIYTINTRLLDVCVCVCLIVSLSRINRKD